MARPRSVSLSPEEMIALGKEMVKFVNDHTDIREDKKKYEEILHLSEWYTIEKKFTYNEWKSFIQKEEFIPYYEQALKIIAKKYINGTINPSIAQRFLRIYFADLKLQENEDLDAEARRRKDVEGAKQSTYTIVVPHDLAIGSNISASELPKKDN